MRRAQPAWLARRRRRVHRAVTHTRAPFSKANAGWCPVSKSTITSDSLIMRAVEKHTELKCLRLYVERG
jgi:hypothetical protein